MSNPRSLYFEKVNAMKSPLQELPDHLDVVFESRKSDLNGTKDIYLRYADQLSQLDNESAKSRAEFIRLQCANADTEDFFQRHQEKWGIPKFEENLVSVHDFKNGFLDTFRDHSTSWCEDIEAREWFFTSIEARLVRFYQFWACDNGPEEILLSASGDYKSIMWTIVKEYQDYSALVSPIFTKQDLQDFYINFDEQKDDFFKEDLLEFMEENPNW